MSVLGKSIYIDLDHDALAIALVSVRTGTPVVEKHATARRPESVRPEDAEGVGAWIAGVMSDAGIGRGRAVFAVARSEVVLKLLRLPGGESLDEGELAGVVRLQMARQTAVSIEDAVVDYVPLSEPDEVGERLVLVGAISGERVEWRRRVAQASGLKLGGVRLRAAGVAELTAASGEGATAPTLGVCIGPESVELALCEGGDLVFARTVELGEARRDPKRAAERIAVEAKRTAMSFRVAQRTSDVAGVIVLGRDELARDVALACAEELGVPGEAAWPEVEGIERATPEDQRALLALAGLARREHVGRALMDFAEPRKAPDLGARRRQLVLAGVFLLIAITGFGWVMAGQRLDTLRERVDAAKGQRAEKQEAYLAMLAADARANHLESWRREDVDWLAHLQRVAETLPDPDQALLDTVSGSGAASVRFTPGQETPYPGRWSVDRRVTLDIAGRASAPGVGVDLRARLLDTGDYRVETKGPDVDNTFSLELSTDRTAPSVEDEPGVTP